jgi:hypothetical protein
MVDLRAAVAAAALGLLACHPSRPSPASPPPIPQQAPLMKPTPSPFRLEIADGNGNVHLCEQLAGGPARFEYRPVRPEDSSSGVYSGGPAREGTLAEADVKALWELVAAAVEDESRHVERREKGTVAIVAEGPTNARVILRAASSAKLLALLASLPRPRD